MFVTILEIILLEMYTSRYRGTVKLLYYTDIHHFLSSIQFRREEDAEKAVNDLNNRWFAGRPVYAELSPVTDFREACCRQYELG